MDELLTGIADAVLNGKLAAVGDLVHQALTTGVAPLAIIQQGLAPGMTEVGVRFKAGDYFLPEVLVSAKTMAAGVAILEPLLAGGTQQEPLGTVLIGTVAGDVHDIGKNIVAMMLRGAGFAVTDLGVNVSSENFVDAVREHRPDILALSALLSTTMPAQEKTIAALAAAGLRDSVKIMVGGAPVKQKWADQIGAESYAADAVEAVDKAKELLGILSGDD